MGEEPEWTENLRSVLCVESISAYNFANPSEAKRASRVNGNPQADNSSKSLTSQQ